MKSKKSGSVKNKKHSKKADRTKAPYLSLNVDIPDELLQLLYLDPPVHQGVPDFQFPEFSEIEKSQLHLRNAMIELYNFNQTQACNNFLIAATLDPDCAFAYWGAAYSVQLNINHIEISAPLLKFAGSCLEKGLTLLALERTSEIERDLVEALKSRTIVPGKTIDSPENWNPSYEQIEEMMKHYSKDMKKLHAKHNNVNVALLYAASIMAIHPWKWWPQGSIYQAPETDVASASTKSAVGILQSILVQYPMHLGAMHYFVHAVEESPHPHVAYNVARTMESFVKDSSLTHLIHVPSHVYSRIGLYQASIDANVRAIEADDRENAKIMRATGLDRVDSYYNIEYYAHNNHFLIVASQKMGNLSYCMKYLTVLENHVHQYIDMKKNQNTFLEHFLTVRCQVYLRFGKYNEILELERPPRSYLLWTAIDSFVRLVALCKLGEKEHSGREMEHFVEANNKFIEEAPKETCRCGCSKRHAGISDPNYGMNKYSFFKKHNIPFEKPDKKCKCSHAESGSKDVKPGGIRPADDKPLPQAVTGTLTINNSVLLAKIREELCFGYLEWYFGDKKLALDYFKTANQNYEDLQYDEPASFQHEVHNIYAGALLMTGQAAEALRVVDRGLIPYPNQLESVFIRMKALENLENSQELKKTKEHLSNLMTFSDFRPSLKNF